MEDTSWEPKSGIVATCPALIGRGEKIPATVKQILKSAKQCQAQAAEEDEQDRADAGRPKVSAGRTLRRSRLPTAMYGQEETREEDTKEKEEGGGRGRLSSSEFGRRGCAGRGACCYGGGRGAGGVFF